MVSICRHTVCNHPACALHTLAHYRVHWRKRLMCAAILDLLSATGPHEKLDAARFGADTIDQCPGTEPATVHFLIGVDTNVTLNSCIRTGLAQQSNDLGAQ